MSFDSAPAQEGLLNGFGTAVASTGLSATATDDLIVVKITAQLASGNSSSVTDNIGNVYLMVPIANPGVSQRHQETWYCLKAVAGVTAVTVNNATSVNVAGTVETWARGSSGLRTQATLNNASSTNPPAALATPAIGDLVTAGFGYQAAAANVRQETLTGTNGFTGTTSINRGGTTMHNSAYKIATTTTATGPLYTLSPAVGSGAITAVFIPATASNVAPVVSAGADQTVEAGAPFTLTGTDSDSDGTISTRAWSQVSGTTIPLTGSGTTRTGTAPITLAGVARTFQYSATDDDAATSTDTMVLTALPAARRMKIGGVIVPCIQRAKLPGSSFLVTDNGDGTLSGTGDISESGGILTSSSDSLSESNGIITYNSV